MPDEQHLDRWLLLVTDAPSITSAGGEDHRRPAAIGISATAATRCFTLEKDRLALREHFEPIVHSEVTYIISIVAEAHGNSYYQQISRERSGTSSWKKLPAGTEAVEAYSFFYPACSRSPPGRHIGNPLPYSRRIAPRSRPATPSRNPGACPGPRGSCRSSTGYQIRQYSAPCSDSSFFRSRQPRDFNRCS